MFTLTEQYRRMEYPLKYPNSQLPEHAHDYFDPFKKVIDRSRSASNQVTALSSNIKVPQDA